jgi:hypothetical protein
MSPHNPPAAATGALAWLEPVRCAHRRTGRSQDDLDAELAGVTFDDTTLQRAAVAVDNPGYVDVGLHSCRHRLGSAPSHPHHSRRSS